MAAHGLLMAAAGWLAVLVSGTDFNPPNDTGSLVPMPSMADLRRSQACAVSMETFGHYQEGYVAPNATLGMSNDGGWCWLGIILYFRETPSVPSVTVTEPPQHGQALVKFFGTHIGIAYQPAPGFTGNDAFTVHTAGPIPHDLPVHVTVSSRN